MANPTPIAAFIAGLVSFLSPCVLPLVPGYVSLISGVGVEELQLQDASLVRKVRDVLDGSEPAPNSDHRSEKDRREEQPQMNAYETQIKAEEMKTEEY